MRIRTVHVDALPAALYGAAAAWMSEAGHEASQQDIREHTHHDDAGVIGTLLAFVYLAPMALLFLLALGTGLLRWRRIHLVLHWFAIVVAVGTLAWGEFVMR